MAGGVRKCSLARRYSNPASTELDVDHGLQWYATCPHDVRPQAGNMQVVSAVGSLAGSSASVTTWPVDPAKEPAAFSTLSRTNAKAFELH